MFEEIISQAVHFLAREQQTDGSFLSFSSSNPADFRNAHVFRSVFPTALILSCLNGLRETPEIREVKEKAAYYLLSQKSQDWSYNYWARRSKEAKDKPYPDDLDDTFCALSSLYEYKPDLLDGTALAKAVQMLTSTEVQVGGPFRTWLVAENAPKVWKDVDIAVNSNIAYFLSLQDIELPNLTNFLEAAIVSKTFRSRYYPTAYPLMYFLSRFYQGQQRDALKAMVLRESHNTAWENPLNSALVILALLNLNVSPTAVAERISYLLKQQTDGRWMPYGFYIDPVIDGKKHFAGSAALTTAFCVLALATYQKVCEKEQQTKAPDMDATLEN